MLYNTRDRLYGRMGSVSVRWRVWGHSSEVATTLRSLLRPVLLEGVVGGGLWGLLSLTTLMQRYLPDESSCRFLKYSLALSPIINLYEKFVVLKSILCTLCTYTRALHHFSLLLSPSICQSWHTQRHKLVFTTLNIFKNSNLAVNFSGKIQQPHAVLRQSEHEAEQHGIKAEQAAFLPWPGSTAGVTWAQARHSLRHFPSPKMSRVIYSTRIADLATARLCTVMLSMWKCNKRCTSDDSSSSKTHSQ